ncbi:MAG: hypothetical protein CMI18_04895 [Opitutaceae bacterium]|nr:hypothetical protein [Opitutaceae bacterium]
MLALALLWIGCNSTEYRIKKYPDLFATLSAEEQLAVHNKTLDLGQSSDAVFFIMGDPDRKKSGVKDGVSKEIWEYSRIYTRPEGTQFSGYERRVYYDPVHKIWRSYHVPRYIHVYSYNQELVAEIEFENGKVSAITEYDT